MCGIVGYIGNKEKKGIILKGLEELEYRGYDSSGMAIMDEKNNMTYFKAVGKIKKLEEKSKDFESYGNGIAIGHTRWATHGKPTEINAHPHLGNYSFVIHNGIIENYKELKDELESKGINFVSQTDTEVIVKIFEDINDKIKDPFGAFKQTISKLVGSFAILLISKVAPGKIFFVKNAVPLMVSKNDDEEIFFSSSDSPLIGYAKEAIYLEDGVYGVASQNELKFYKNNEEISNLEKKPLPKDKSLAQKNGYRFFMEKEIYEQSIVATETLMGRIKNYEIKFDDIDKDLFDNINEIVICACGTSYHAGLVASYLFERIAKIRTKVEVASEFRYKEPVINKNSLFIVISQSGETADTLEALKIAKDAGLKTLAICNVDNSSIVRLAGNVLLTRAGIEKSVASTKAFTTQVLTLWMVVLYFANLKNTISKSELKNEVKALLNSPKALEVPNGLQDKIYRMSKHYLHGHGFFFVGRDVFYPLALEGALKLKEVSYLHAEGYASGEMKHGPIALVDEGLFTIALLPKNMLYEKTRSNIEEIVARDGYTFVLSPEEFDLSDDFIKTTSHSHYMSEFFEMLVILQIFALEISNRLGNDVDMPRNLAKSVTVE